MQIKPIKLEQLTIENNVWLAPLAGYTNYPFRKVCYASGAGLAFSEMVSAKGLFYRNENTEVLLTTGADEKVKAAQIFGSDPAIMREVCSSEALAPFSIIDINMGCPMPKIYNNGEGSALLLNPALAEKIVSEVKKSGKIVTVKMRTGVKEGEEITEEFARRMEGAGASLISIHGRTKEKIYAGEVNFSEIAAAKRAVKIPVMANGGVFSPEDADELMEKTGADGILLARGALYNPLLFSEILGREKPSFRKLFLEELDETERLFGTHFAVVFMRKMASFYVKGLRGAAEWKNRLFAAKSTAEIQKIVEEIGWN